MNIVGIVIAVLFIITISNFVFKKFNILIDQTNISSHKSFINGHKTIPLSGGFVFFLILVFFLPENYQYFTILIFFIFLTGLLSDLDILHSPFFRIIFQTIIIVVYLFLFDNFVSSIRVDFFDNLLNIFFIKLFFTSFCILVLINGTNFIDCIDLFLKDPETKSILMIGEIGGTAEEEASEFIKNHEIKKPIVGFVAGLTAPSGKRMGHAGAIISGGQGGADQKIKKMESCGITVAKSPSEIGKTLLDKLTN